MKQLIYNTKQAITDLQIDNTILFLNQDPRITAFYTGSTIRIITLTVPDNYSSWGSTRSYSLSNL